VLGAHVSSQGGVALAPARGGALRASAIQLFTKTPNQWRERWPDVEQIARFRSEVARHKIDAVVSHDSYLINLASPEPVLRARSLESFKQELQRSSALGLRAVVSVSLAIVAFALSIERLGLVLAIVLLTGIGALATKALRPLETAIAALVLTVLSWGIFIAGLGLTIPVWPDW